MNKINVGDTVTSSINTNFKYRVVKCFKTVCWIKDLPKLEFLFKGVPYKILTLLKNKTT